MSIRPGERCNQYDILSPLGKGGMGEVYLAEDTRLKRKVALKLLPPEFTQSVERLRRFEQEAQATSALNHPNIITLYEISAVNGTHFITTEYVAGQTLRARLQQPLTQTEAVDIALQIAHALAAAHNANIIHRDIKPENVMLREDGIVKVLDFGLAKLSEVRSAEFGMRNEDAETLLQGDPDTSRSALRTPHSTTPGTVMGTASYMSPEQARGEKVDARSDLFSLGIVLYEMLAGRQPFAGANMLDVVGAILHRDFAPLPDAPAELQRIVTKALQKDREARYQTAQDFAHDLQEWKDERAYQTRAARSSNEKPTLLQTPAEAEPAHEQAVRVPASAGPYAAPAHPPTEVGTLNTRARRLRFSLIALVVLLLAVAAYFFFARKATPAFTEREPLLLADFENKTGEEIWDGTLKQALAVALEQSPYMNIFPEERARDTLRLMNRSVDEPITRATGREICQRRNVRALLIGTITKLERNYAVTLEATNAQSNETIARTLEQAAGRDDVVKAVERAAKGLREKLGESLASLQKHDKPLQEATTSSLEALKIYSSALTQKWQGNPQESIPLFLRAIELDANFALAYFHLASSYENLDPERSVEYAEKAYELRERVSEQEQLAILGFYYGFVRGDFEKELETHKLSVQTYPGKALIHGFLCWDYGVLGQTEKAVEESRLAMTLAPDASVHVNQHAESLIQAGRFEEAKQAILQAQARKAENSYFRRALYWIGVVQGDEVLMQQQLAAAKGREDDHRMLGVQAQATAFSGRLRESDAQFAKAVEQARQQRLPKVATQYEIEAALIKNVYGLPSLAQTNLARALQLSPTNFTHALVSEIFPLGPLAVALSGNFKQAQTFGDETARRYPYNTLTQAVWLPASRAAIELQRSHPGKAIELLQPALQYEAGARFWPTWLRAQAYLQLKQGTQAAAEFQKIIDHRGWDVTSPLWPLAHLGLARAAVLQGDGAKAKQTYDEFFRLWKDADADLPVLFEAQKEYAKLK